MTWASSLSDLKGQYLSMPGTWTPALPLYRHYSPGCSGILTEDLVELVGKNYEYVYMHLSIPNIPITKVFGIFTCTWRNLNESYPFVHEQMKYPEYVRRGEYCGYVTTWLNQRVSDRIWKEKNKHLTFGLDWQQRRYSQ